MSRWNAPIPKYTFESLDQYFARRDATLKQRRSEVQRDEPDEPTESILDACERRWAKGVLK